MTRDLSWETNSTDTVYEGRSFDVLADHVELPNGGEFDFEYVGEPNAVVVFPVTTDDEVVTVTEWRQPVRRSVTGLPGGSIEDGESPAATARRELAEETGYRPDRLEATMTVETTNGISDGVHHHFVAHGCEPTAERDMDETESVSVELTPLSELRSLVTAGEVRDAKTLLGLFGYQLFAADGGCGP
ncbi:NUDIX hydrolase [Halorussus salinisoli]|uniref:NUDIX hydrolase n=1 Tax=Halorussus salinisoli TaxID=2558242 RepID=UPI0010C209B3|nr:NUDIX hydrolase [Halorussus salinisoli]